MRRTSLLAGGAAALAMSLGAAPAASAADTVFGGSTTGYQAIVLNGDKAAKKLRSAVVAWRADCADGMGLPMSMTVEPSAGSPGFSPSPTALTMSRNRKGRFSGTQEFGVNFGDFSAAIKVRFVGRLRAKAASGTLSADAVITENASGNTATTCRTGRLRWNATRAPGRVYGGKTSQDYPIVAKLDARRKQVTDVILGWETSTCEPDMGFGYPEHLSNFPLASTGRFGDTWDDTVKDPDGGSRRFDYALTGRVARRIVRGTLRIAITGTDAAGAKTLSCDTGGVSWKATTG
jgi:hypothetical protein